MILKRWYIYYNLLEFIKAVYKVLNGVRDGTGLAVRGIVSTIYNTLYFYVFLILFSPFWTVRGGRSYSCSYGSSGSLIPLLLNLKSYIFINVENADLGYNGRVDLCNGGLYSLIIVSNSD